MSDEVDGRVLRLALVIDGFVLPRFLATAVEEIQRSSFARVELVVRRDPAPSPARSGRLVEWYLRADSRRRGAGDDPLEIVDCRALLGTVPVVQAAKSIDALRSSSIDVVLDLSSQPPDAALADGARHGVWTVVPGEGSHASRPAGFWEALRDEPITAVSIVVVRRDGRYALSRGYFTTRAESFAWNRRQPLWGSIVLLMQHLQALQQGGWDATSRKAEALPERADEHVPTNLEMARWLGRKATRRAAKVIRRPTVRHWRIATRIGSPLAITNGNAPDLSGFRFHESPVGHFYADPFLWERDGLFWLFFEDYDYRAERGVIACATVRPDNALADVRTVLDAPYHLSYPCVFEADGELYMVPETGGNGAVDLYRCEEFPNRWVRDRTLLDFGGIDNTVVEVDGRWWMTTSVAEPRSRARQLWLFSSETVSGAWTPHPANPLSTDIRSNRGGGAFLHDDGRLIRVAQDCGRTYGYSLGFYEVTVLTADRYEERPLLTVLPTWGDGIDGTHTYARVGAVEAVDAAIERPRRGTIA